MEAEVFYSEFFRVVHQTRKNSLHEQAQNLLGYTEKMDFIYSTMANRESRELTEAEKAIQAATTSFHIKYNGSNGYVPNPERDAEFVKRVKSILWANRSDW
jgi:hypothetical protein